MTAYWALGGSVGLGLLSEGIREQADERETWFVGMLWCVVAAKGGATAVALILRAPQRLPAWLARTLVVLTALGGAGMAVYGAVGIVGGAIALLFLGDTETDATAAYVFLWSPLWLLGGLLFLGTAWHARRRIRQGRSIPVAARAAKD